MRRPCPVAALVATMSTPPRGSPVAATRLAMSSSSPMWAGTASASAPASLTSPATLLAGVRLPAGHGHLRPRSGEAVGDGAGDAPAPTGDDGDPVGQVEQSLEIAAVHGRTS